MKRAKLAPAALSLVLLLTGCGPQPAGPGSADSARWNPALNNILGLTAEQRLEDYDYFRDTLQNSYLYLGVHDREVPDDPSSGIFDEYRELIAANDTDEAFYTALYSCLYRLNGFGHLWLIEPEGYQATVEAAQLGAYSDKPYWAEVIGSSKAREGYAKLSAYLAERDKDDPYDGQSPTVDEDYQNLRTMLLPGGEIGYIKIDSFLAPYEYEEEQNALFAFYEQAANCTDLIIDLTENSGGSELYWQNLIVAPHIDQPLACENYALLAKSENNTPYIESAFRPEELHPIAELPKLPAFQQSGTQAATHFIVSKLAVSPSAYRSPFRGRLWFLVNESVYSASESLCVFAKQTGFATLVGTQTGGDGIGALDPVYMTLPNSGLMIQYSMMFGLNPDGSSSEEAGTTPDIVSPAGETPLITALRAIIEK
ncbi:S41 family peptidase [Agathobaculum sp. NTUH-O15-33]|uniref:S41 family peptidase n=1 Tax=Agathobaculum sp. NTUH-O15-33 TaxID=3079302 RepID=UPI002958AE56|nr:S41 family peptidase [Agathobaculum sp. NTUH-O15-33]WNX84193.1 S41 family peptidase [Agathobaculum sp. NTUH-O15-33]